MGGQNVLKMGMGRVLKKPVPFLQLLKKNLTLQKTSPGSAGRPKSPYFPPSGTQLP